MSSPFASSRPPVTPFPRRPISAAALVILTFLSLPLAANGRPASAAPTAGPGAFSVETGIHYRTAPGWDGTSTDLSLDLYRPVAPAPTHPALVWIHGGGFTGGSPSDPADVEIASFLASAGIATISIEYRLGPDGPDSSDLTDPLVLGRILRAFEDATAAVAFTRAHADQWGIDPARIFVGGASAGAATALDVAYLPDRNTDPRSPAAVAGVVSLVGRTLPQFVQTGEAPMVMINGAHDPIVHLDDARATCDAALAVGVECELHALDMGHGDVEHLPEVERLMSAWLQEHIRAAPPSTTAPIAPPTTGSTSPVAAAVDAAPHFTG